MPLDSSQFPRSSSPGSAGAQPPVPLLVRLARLPPALGVALLALGAVLLGALLAAGVVALLPGAGALAAPLAAGLGMLLVTLPLGALVLRLVRQVERQREQLTRFDSRDSTTGVANRSQFMALAEREWARSRRYGIGAAVLFIEIDRFRQLGAARGVAAADAVLRELALSAAQTLRGADLLARFGESQFAVFLAQADPTGALDAAERIRERTEQLEIAWSGQALRATVSVGVATLGPAHANLTALLADAEQAVGAARHTGGNSVRAAPVDATGLPVPGSSVDDKKAAGPR